MAGSIQYMAWKKKKRGVPRNIFLAYMRLSNYYKLNSLYLTLTACHYIFKIEDSKFLLNC